MYEAGTILRFITSLQPDRVYTVLGGSFTLVKSEKKRTELYESPLQYSPTFFSCPRGLTLAYEGSMVNTSTILRLNPENRSSHRKEKISIKALEGMGGKNTQLMQDASKIHNTF